MIKNENTYTVHGWMINDYNLSGNDLSTYAIIYGFSQEENNTFVCSLDYLSSWLCCTKKTAEKALFNLKEKGLIEQLVVGNNKYKKSEYRALRPENFTVVNSTIVKNTTVTMEKITTANINNINNNIKESNNINIITKENNENLNRNDNLVESTKYSLTSPNVVSLYNLDNNVPVEPKCEMVRFKKPTVEEIEKYCEERANGIDAQKFFDHYESVGWHVGKNKMKDWKAAVRTWENNNKNKQEQITIFETPIEEIKSYQ